MTILPSILLRRRLDRRRHALVADTALSGGRVVRKLDAIVAIRGKPLAIVSDNGTELTSTAGPRWSHGCGRSEANRSSKPHPMNQRLHGFGARSA
jgi:hypothetical protein